MVVVYVVLYWITYERYFNNVRWLYDKQLLCLRNLAEISHTHLLFNLLKVNYLIWSFKAGICFVVMSEKTQHMYDKIIQ